MALFLPKSTAVSSTETADADFFRSAEEWHVDFVLRERRSRATAWTVAIGATVVASLAVAAVAMLTPLKTVKPYVIRVDNATGVVDIVQALDHATTTYDEAVTKYFLAQYVRSRESYTRETVYSLFNSVLLMSDGAQRQQYKHLYERSNPQSPITMLGDYGKAEARITNISFLSKSVAAVRYLLTINTGGTPTPPSHMIATVTFKYVSAPMGEQARLVNPLGFLVTDYRTDPEAVGVAPPAGPATASIAAAPNATPLPIATATPSVPAP